MSSLLLTSVARVTRFWRCCDSVCVDYKLCCFYIKKKRIFFFLFYSSKSIHSFSFHSLRSTHRDDRIYSALLFFFVCEYKRGIALIFYTYIVCFVSIYYKKKEKILYNSTKNEGEIILCEFSSKKFFFSFFYIVVICPLILTKSVFIFCSWCCLLNVLMSLHVVKKIYISIKPNINGIYLNGSWKAMKKKPYCAMRRIITITTPKTNLNHNKYKQAATAKRVNIALRCWTKLQSMCWNLFWGQFHYLVTSVLFSF